MTTKTTSTGARPATPSTHPALGGGMARSAAVRMVRIAALSLSLVAGLIMAGDIPSADARITSGSATMYCEAGQVKVNMPQVRSSYSGSMVYAYVQLYYWTGSRWAPTSYTGHDVAYAYTLNNGWDWQWYFAQNNHGALRWHINVARGYTYTARLTVGDAKDGHVRTIWATSSCRA